MAYGIIKVDQVTFTNAGVDQTISVSGIVASISGNITATGTISGNVIRGGTTVSGATVTGTAGQFGTITGNTAGFTTVTGTTVTGTTANFATVSGTTITGTTLTVASGTFTGNSTAAAFIPTGSTVPTDGVYLPAANTVGVATNGTGRLFVDPSGNIGVSVSSPATASFGNVIRNKAPSGTGAAGYFSEGANSDTWFGVYSGTGTSDSAALVYPSTGSLRIATTTGVGIGGFSEKIRITSTGLVGIGTSAPEYKLDTFDSISSASSSVSRSVNTYNNYDANPTTSYPVLSIERSGKIGYSYSSRAAFSIARYENVSSNARTRLDIQLSHGNTGFPDNNVMSLLSSGSVGIGTASPAGKCVVRVSNNTGAPTAWNSNFLVVSTGDTSLSSGIGFSVDTSDNSTSISALTPGTSWLKQYYRANSHTFWYGDAGVTQGMTLDSSGRLLVGTSSGRNIADAAQGTIQVETLNFGGISITNNRADASGPNLAFGKSRSGSIGGTTIVQNGDGLGAVVFGGADGIDLETPGAMIAAYVDGTPGANDMPGRLVFSTTADGASSPTERMRITSAGYVHFATSPSTSTPGVLINSTDSRIAGNFGSGGELSLHAEDSSSAGARGFLGGSGRGDANKNRVVFTPGSNGVYLAENATSWTASSDERKKTDLVAIHDGLSKVGKLRAVTGRYLTDAAGTSRSFLIAQDIQAVLPEAVDTSDPDSLGVSYTDVIPLLVAALKESKERIETLEAEVAALKGQ